MLTPPACLLPDTRPAGPRAWWPGHTHTQTLGVPVLCICSTWLPCPLLTPCLYLNACSGCAPSWGCCLRHKFHGQGQVQAQSALVPRGGRDQALRFRAAGVAHAVRKAVSNLRKHIKQLKSIGTPSPAGAQSSMLRELLDPHLLRTLALSPFDLRDSVDPNTLPDWGVVIYVV